MDLGLLWNYIKEGFNNPQVPPGLIVSILLMTLVLGIFEYFVYRYVSKRSFYSKQFNITLAIIPLFIATIIMTLQSNLLITLGTIGALAIIRFRTAIKDPIDMVYLLWSVFIGITCGSGLFEVAIITSLVVTVLLLVLDLLPLRKPPFILVVNASNPEVEKSIVKIIKEGTQYYKVKSRTMSENRYDLVLELKTKDDANLVESISKLENVNNVSMVAFDGENFS